MGKHHQRAQTLALRGARWCVNTITIILCMVAAGLALVLVIGSGFGQREVVAALAIRITVICVGNIIKRIAR